MNSWFKARGSFPDVVNHPLYGILWDAKLELKLRPHDDIAEGFKLGLSTFTADTSSKATRDSHS